MPRRSTRQKAKKVAAATAPAPAPAPVPSQKGPADFVRYTPDPSETFKSLATRMGIDYTKGCGFYLLVKKEKISAKKDMVLLKCVPVSKCTVPACCPKLRKSSIEHASTTCLFCFLFCFSPFPPSLSRAYDLLYFLNPFADQMEPG